MKKLTKEETKKAIKLYTEDKISMAKIGKLFNVSRPIIRRILIENDIKIYPPVKRYRGGITESSKRYYKKNKEERKAYASKWQKDNKELAREYHRKWRNKNRENYRERARNAKRKKYQTDPIFRLNENMHYGLWASLKDKHLDKAKRTFDILPYTVEEFKNHLELLFKEGMTWDNYGEWHVDHKKPICSFNFKSIEDIEFLECWSLDNLQPLWGIENAEKGCKILD